MRMALLLRNLGNPRARIGAGLLRISLGMAMLYEYAINYSQRHDLWGPDRIAREYPVLEFSPYAWSASAVYFDIVFHVGILVAFLFVLGIGGRVTTCAMWAMTWFLQDLNNLIGDGGDNIARIVLLYMIFADVSGRRERSVSLVSVYCTMLRYLRLQFKWQCCICQPECTRLWANIGRTAWLSTISSG